MQIFSPRGNRLPEGINTKYVITFDLRILFFSNFAHIYDSTRPIQQKRIKQFGRVIAENELREVGLPARCVREKQYS